MTEFRIGNGYDIHALGAGLPLVLGGVKIPHTKGCIAHSDGDVLLHALCDALLGAAALGDIGKLFPDTSEQWKGADSKDLLRIVMERVREKGWTVGNVDITIALQAPKIGPLVPRMRDVLASVMDIEKDQVSVKATTTEKLGFVGRGEGCECWAVALLKKI